MDIASLKDAPWNPRSAMDGDRLIELVHSIKDCGVLVPIVVRVTDGGAFEVVCGHRRVEACRQLGLTDVQAVIHDNLDDDAARLIALVENVQREDLTAMDEAVAYRAMIDAGMSIDEVAGKASRSKSAVYQRLKLLDLSDQMIRAIDDGLVSVSAAVLIANIPDDGLRREAEADILDEAGHGEAGPIGPSVVKRIIESSYSSNLKRAAFDTADATLRPDRGPCGECPHRTGNQADLFSGVMAADSPDMCTDPPCFREKAHVSAARALQKHADKGLETLAPEESEKILRGSGGYLSGSSKYIMASGKCYADPQDRTFAKLMKGTDVKPIAAADSTGKVHMLYPKAAVNKVLKTVHGIGVKPAGAKIDRKAESLRKEATKAATDAAMVAIRGVTAVKSFAPTDTLWKMLAHGVASRLDYASERAACERNNLDDLGAFITESAPGWGRVLLIEMLLFEVVRELVDSDEDDPEIVTINEAFGIDLLRIANEAKAEVTGEPVAERAPAKKKARAKK